MFERLTDAARRALIEAQGHAHRFGHRQVGTGHFLLGLAEADGTAALFSALGSGRDTLRERLLELAPARAEPTSGSLPFTPALKEALELGIREALRRESNRITTDHLLVGTVLVGDEPTRALIERTGLTDPDRIRSEARRIREAGDPHRPAIRPITAEQVRQH